VDDGGLLPDPGNLPPGATRPGGSRVLITDRSRVGGGGEVVEIEVVQLERKQEGDAMSLEANPEPASLPVRSGYRAGWRSVLRVRTKILAKAAVGLTVLVAGAVTVQGASADSSPSSSGPDPTAAMVSSGQGPFGEETVSVPAGNGFGGGTIHLPKNAGSGPFGVVVICPALSAGKGYYEWMGAKAASFGLVSFVIDTNNPGDLFDARRDQILAAADWLAKSSPVKDKVDANRIGVVGHSAGGGGAINAAQQRSSIKAAIGMAPVGANTGGLKVPTMLVGATNDGWSSPQTLKGMYGSAAGAKALVEITNAGHGFPAGGSMEMFRAVLPWLKLFVDDDTRYAQFLCPGLLDKTNIHEYQATCPLIPSGTATASLSNTRLSVSSPSSTGNAAGCQVTYKVMHQWTGGVISDVIVSNGGSPVKSWTLTFDMPSPGQRLVLGWNGKFTQSGSRVTVTNASWNGSLAAGGTAKVGFVAKHNGSNPEPTGFRLNGATCNGTAPTTPPTSPGTASPGATPAGATSPGTSSSTSTPGGSLPCDAFEGGGTPCVAAYGTVRALYASYDGPLYQVQRDSDHQYLDIRPLSAGGYADADPQVSFCAGTKCIISKLYDQSSNHNDMPISWGGFWKGPGPNGSDVGADAMALPVTVAGHKVFGVMVTPGVGYRVDKTKGVAVGAEPEGMYMVTSSDKTSPWCCFDFGNAQTTHTADGPAIMDTIYWGTACWFKDCVGKGPWVQADLEFGMFHNAEGSNKDPNNQGVNYPFVSAWLKNDGVTNFTLKWGNANAGGLTTPYSGPLPKGYSPMKKQGGVLLGTGGDNSQLGVGEFFEGAMTAGYPKDATENAVQANIVSAGFAKS
jgi:dienelactone hydrolase